MGFTDDLQICEAAQTRVFDSCHAVQLEEPPKNPNPQFKTFDALPVKRCIFPEPPPEPELDPCEIQRRDILIKSGVVFCEKEPVVQEIPKTCLAVCLEKIKNVDVGLRDDSYDCRYTDQYFIDQEKPDTSRCDAIIEAAKGRDEPAWPRCPYIPPPPPDPEPDPCEIQEKEFLARQLKERCKRWIHE